MRIPLGATKEIQLSFESVNQRVDELERGDIDLRNRRRCINAPSAKRDDDYVTMGEVKRMLKNIEQTLARLQNVT